MTLAQGLTYFGTGLAAGLVLCILGLAALLAVVALMPSVELDANVTPIAPGHAVRSHRAGRGTHARTRRQRCPWPPVAQAPRVPAAWTRRTRLAIGA